MNKTLEFKAMTKDALHDKIKKGEPLKMPNVDRQYYSLGVSSKRIPLAEIKKRFFRAQQSQSTLDLMRRYFVLRVAQSRGYGG